MTLTYLRAPALVSLSGPGPQQDPGRGVEQGVRVGPDLQLKAPGPLAVVATVARVQAHQAAAEIATWVRPWVSVWPSPG